MDSISVPTHTQVVTPGTTDTSHHRLRITATVCWKLFERCTKVSPSHLGRNYGKFKVWCGNLGVRQGGHASLDWRLKDDDIMENEVFSMLTDLEDDLQQVLELLSGTRPPYEQEECGSETSSFSGSVLPGELEVRLDAINATMTVLYQMSFLVRNQGTRRLASARAQTYQPQDPDEAALLESFVSFDRQHIDDLFRDLRQPRSDEGQPMASRADHRSDAASQDRALKVRLLAASTARRRQLAYWRMHSSKLKSIAAIPETADPDPDATIYSGTEASGVFKLIEKDFDIVEVQSLTSVASTVRDMDGHETEFPGPPERSSDDDPFECPYCFVLCQPEEAGRRRWRKHILEDLRPYICTYPDCQDGTQLYGSLREWTAHEDKAHRSCRTSDVDTPDKSVNTENRMECPICLLDVADLSSRTTLTKHLASHLERFSLDCLPLNTSSWGNEISLDDKSESSDPDPDQASAVREDLAPNEQDVATESFGTKQSLDKVDEVDEFISMSALTRAIAEDRRLPSIHGIASSLTGPVDAVTEEGDLRVLERGLERIEFQNKQFAENPEPRRKIHEDEPPEETTQEATPELWGIQADNKHILAEFNRRRRMFEEVQETGLSVLESLKRESIDLERKRIVEDYERKQRQAKEEAGDDKSSVVMKSEGGMVDAEGKRISGEYERRERELMQQEGRGVAEFLTDRMKGLVNDMITGHNEVNDAMRKHLAKLDITQSQIDAFMEKEDEGKQQPASRTSTTAPPSPPPPPGDSTTPHAPVYPKIHTDHLAIEALKYHRISWEYDKSDPSYIVIPRELDEGELNVLFEFTKGFREEDLAG